MILKLDRRKKVYVVSRDRDLSWYRRHLPWFAHSYYLYGDGLKDGDAINEAIEFLPRNPGGEIALLEGQFNGVAVDLTARTRVTINGRGPSTIVVGDGVNPIVSCIPAAFAQQYYAFRDFHAQGLGGVGTAFQLRNLMDVTLENLEVTDLTNGVDSEGCVFDKYKNIAFRNIITRVLFFYGGGFPLTQGNDHYLHHITYDSDGALRPIGIELGGSGAMVLAQSDFIHCDIGCLINPGAGETNEWQLIEQTYFDYCAQQAIKVIGAGIVRGVFFNNTWFATCGQIGPDRDGVTVNNALIDGLIFSNCHNHNHNGAGYYVNAGKNVKIKGGEVAGVNGAVIGANGIYINDQVEVRGVYLGRTFTWTNDPLYHIYLDAGADALIEDNDLDANALTAPIRLAGTHRIRRNRGIVTENSGMAGIAHPATTVVVNHGLDVPPPDPNENICVWPVGGWGASTVFWVDTVTATQFTIHVDPAPGVDNTFNFGWRAELV